MYDSKTEERNFNWSKNNMVQQLTFEVENIEKTLEEIKGRGIMLIGENPRFGAENSEFEFDYAQTRTACSLSCIRETNLRGDKNEQN